MKSLPTLFFFILIFLLIGAAFAETRYMRQDEVLGTVQTLAYDSIQFNAYDGNVQVNQSLGIRVWHNNTEITSGTATAIAVGKVTAIISATWTPTETVLNNEYICVKVYADDFSPPTTWLQTFNTTVLDGTQLDSVEWTVYYYLLRVYAGGVTKYTFRYGTVTYPSRIEGFSYSTPQAGTHLTETFQQVAGAYQQFSDQKKLLGSYQQVGSAFQQFTSSKKILGTFQQLAEAIATIITVKALHGTFQQNAMAFQEFIESATTGAKHLVGVFQQVAGVFQEVLLPIGDEVWLFFDYWFEVTFGLLLMIPVVVLLLWRRERRDEEEN